MKKNTADASASLVSVGLELEEVYDVDALHTLRPIESIWEVLDNSTEFRVIPPPGSTTSGTSTTPS